jgi:hypothetical protein
MQCRQCERESAVNDEELCQKCAQLCDRAQQLIERDELPKFSVHEFHVTAGRSRVSGQRCALCGDVIQDRNTASFRTSRFGGASGAATSTFMISATVSGKSKEPLHSR